MSRHSAPPSRAHCVRYTGDGNYRLTWVIDRYREGRRLRYPRLVERTTDIKGALRFAKRWGGKILDARDASKRATPALGPVRKKRCRHTAPQLPNSIAGTVVFRTTKTGARRYPVKCSACGMLRELPKAPGYWDTAPAQKPTELERLRAEVTSLRQAVQDARDATLIAWCPSCKRLAVPRGYVCFACGNDPTVREDGS